MGPWTPTRFCPPPGRDRTVCNSQLGIVGGWTIPSSPASGNSWVVAPFLQQLLTTSCPPAELQLLLCRDTSVFPALRGLRGRRSHAFVHQRALEAAKPLRFGLPAKNSPIAPSAGGGLGFSPWPSFTDSPSTCGYTAKREKSLFCRVNHGFSFVCSASRFLPDCNRIC